MSSVTFKQAGYYRLKIYAVGSGNESEAIGDSTIINARARELWILVDSAGGRLTDGFDSTAIAGRSPEFGSYGAFLPQASLRGPVGLALGPYNYSGTVTYLLQSGQPAPVADAQVVAGCGQQTQFGLVFTNQTFQTAANGSFAYTCAADKPYTRTTINMFNSIAFVRGAGGAFAGASFNGANGGVFNVRVVNDRAAEVHKTLKEQAPDAFVRFGRSRSWVTVYVAQSGPAFTAFYTSGGDRIELGAEDVYGESGIWTTVHEYGHAFHWKAIEPPASDDCNPESHSIGGPNTLACAFKEGFADFFASWVAGEKLIAQGAISDNVFEDNPYRLNGDGSRIEGAAAGFFYDLVDGASEPDSPTNTANGDESFDTASYPGSFIATFMSSCSFTVITVSVTKLDGMDQFVYCVERSLSAKPLGVSWRPFTTIQPPSAPVGWDPALIRRLWRYNFYNVAP